MTDKQLQKRVEKISDIELKDLDDEQLQNLSVSLGTIQNRVTKEYSDRLRLYSKQRYDFFGDGLDAGYRRATQELEGKNPFTDGQIGKVVDLFKEARSKGEQNYIDYIIKNWNY